MKTYKGDFLRSEWWQRTCDRLKQEAHYCCQECKTETSDLHVHHLKYGVGYERDDDDSMEWWMRGRGWCVWDMYLKVLCEDCHDAAHGRGTWSDLQRRVDALGKR